jgi:hypothetical protein
MCTGLGAAGWTGDCCLEPGEVAWETLCINGDEPGKAWARLVQIYPSPRFPSAGEPVNPQDCQAQWAMRIELGAIACMCWEQCDCDIKQANARLTLNMVQAALQSVGCCWPDVPVKPDVRVAELVTVGPEGGSAGFVMQLVLPTEVCCAPVPS